MSFGVNPMMLSTSSISWVSNDGVSDQFPAGLRVLVVDDDPTCLMILEKMLKSCYYEVTKCSRAEVALKFLRDKKDGFDVVISDVHMPDMDGFRLLEHIGLEMDLPVIMMSADDSKSVVMKGVTHGACDYLIKPVRMEALRNIWQHVVRKKKHEYKDKEFELSGSVEDGDNQQKLSEDVDYSSSANEGNWKSSKKRKEEEDDGDERDDQSTLKKPRVVWSVDLHQQFVNAVNQLGIDKAVPKKILELMNVPGITRENVASHLQKYRLYLRRISGQHPNGLGNSLMSPQDSPYGLYGALDFQNLASSSQLAPQSLATIQAEGLTRSFTKPVGSIPNLFSYDNSKMQQHINGNRHGNLLHGIPTAMDSKHLAAFNQSPQTFGSLHSPLVQPRSRNQLLNEIGSGHSLNLPSPSLFGINNRAPAYTSLSQSQPTSVVEFTSLSQPSSVVDFASLSQPSSVVDFTRSSANSFLLQDGVNSEMKGTGGFVPIYGAVDDINQRRATKDWGVGSSSQAPQFLNSDVLPSVLVQPGFSADERNLSPCVSSSRNPDRFPMGFRNMPNEYDPEDLMSVLLNQNQESDLELVEFGLDDLPA